LLYRASELLLKLKEKRQHPLVQFARAEDSWSANYAEEMQI